MPEKVKFGKRIEARDKVSSFYGVRTIERSTGP
jgi:hypothetical protein